jgi:adenosylcobinamide kinase / adenosylcobinamide-phosphate guanylyltransferase
VTVRLYTGGVRSGKSRLAETQALITDPHLPHYYLATAVAFDLEMQARVALHQQQRDPAWIVCDDPERTIEYLQRFNSKSVILLDCLTLWLTHFILKDNDFLLQKVIKDLLAGIRESEASIFIVTNEVGSGIVPKNALSRRFRDEAGMLNQAVAQSAQEVFFVTCGLPLKLK